MSDTEKPVEPTDPSVIKLGDQTLKLLVPGSPGLRYEVWRATATSEAFAHAAALAFCSSKIFHMTGNRVRYDIVTYGREVIDTLIEKGCNYLDICDAGRAAFLFLIEGLSFNRSAEVKAVEDFTAATPDTSTG